MTAAAAALGAAVGAAGLLPFGAFSWALKGHFRRSGRMPGGMRVVSLLSAGFYLWFLWRLWRAPPAAIWPAGVMLFAVSLMLFGWAVGNTRRHRPTLAFSTDPPVFLVRAGPFRYVRHPFYLSYLIFWTGTALATRGVAGWLAPLVMVSIYTAAAVLEERKFAASPLAEAYAAYRRAAGMFLPGRTPKSNGSPP